MTKQHKKSKNLPSGKLNVSLKIGDIIIIILLTGLAIFFAIDIFMEKKHIASKYIIIESPYKRTKYEFKPQTKRIKIKGRLGDSVILISTNYVKMLDSPCPNKLCIKQGKIYNPGESIICVPNQIIIKIVAKENIPRKVDAICR